MLLFHNSQCTKSLFNVYLVHLIIKFISTIGINYIGIHLFMTDKMRLKFMNNSQIQKNGRVSSNIQYSPLGYENENITNHQMQSAKRGTKKKKYQRHMHEPSNIIQNISNNQRRINYNNLLSESEHEINLNNTVRIIFMNGENFSHNNNLRVKSKSHLNNATLIEYAIKSLSSHCIQISFKLNLFHITECESNEWNCKELDGFVTNNGYTSKT